MPTELACTSSTRENKKSKEQRRRKSRNFRSCQFRFSIRHTFKKDRIAKRMIKENPAKHALQIHFKVKILLPLKS